MIEKVNYIKKYVNIYIFIIIIICSKLKAFKYYFSD